MKNYLLWFWPRNPVTRRIDAPYIAKKMSTEIRYSPDTCKKLVVQYNLEGKSSYLKIKQTSM